MDLNERIGSIRARISAIDLRELMNAAAETLRHIARDFAATLEDWMRAIGSVEDPSLRLLAGVLALAALGTAAVLAVRMIRHRRHRASDYPRATVSGASRKSWTECAARVDRLASLGAGQAEVARTIGVPRDVLGILAPTVDWNRSKLPRSAGSAAQRPVSLRFAGRLR